MKRYSIAPSSSRRKSTIGPNLNDSGSSKAELEKLEQETTLVLQEVDKNLSKANAIINDKIFPILKDYANNSENVWNKVSFWKYFFEQSANVELSSYEAKIDTETDVNTMANANSNFLYRVGNEYNQQGAHESEPKLSEKKGVQGDGINTLKKPFLKNAVEESTPTWSTEQPKFAGNQIQASTPQFQKSLSSIANANRTAPGIGPYPNLEIQPPPALTNTLSSSEPTVPQSMDNASAPTKTQTIRQSLNSFQRISMSPRKPKTPIYDIASDEAKRRSSMIQDLINSSPTLPEPPVLQSEIEIHGGSDEKEISFDTEKKNEEELSPVILPKELTPSRTKHNDGETLQRFPTTPMFTRGHSGERLSNIIKTPLGVRIRYGEDDSDLAPPQLENNESSQSHSALKRPSDYDLQHSQSERDSEVKNIDNEAHHTLGKRRKTKSFTSEADDNVFLDNSNQKSNSVASTLYHSIVNQHDITNTSNNKDRSKEDNNTQSRSISYLFEEVLSNASSSKNQKDEKNKDERLSEDGAKDLFGDLTTHQQDNTAENSTSELGSFLGERYKNLTNYKNS